MPGSWQYQWLQPHAQLETTQTDHINLGIQLHGSSGSGIHVDGSPWLVTEWITELGQWAMKGEVLLPAGYLWAFCHIIVNY